MYDMVQEQSKPERRWSLRLGTTIALFLILVVIILVLWSVRYQLNYREFVSHFSNSNIYAAENLCFHADVRGETIRGKRDNVEKFYSYVILSGIGRVEPLPEGDPDITIDFGDGGTMKFWETDHKKFKCYLYYEHTDGFSYGYYSSSMTVDTIAVNYLSRRDNVPWNGEL